MTTSNQLTENGSQGPADLHVPPAYCQYANGPCDQTFADLDSFAALCLYASEPRSIASTIETAVNTLRDACGDPKAWRLWKDLPIRGQMIFTEICKGMRSSSVVVADVTTLNFNLMFEIGFAIGLGLPVVPVRDATMMSDKKDFDGVGLLDTLGYLDFTNSSELAEKLREPFPKPLPIPPRKTYTDSPIYVLKGPIETEGAVLLLSTLKKSRLRFRAHDPQETRRLSLSAARKQVRGSTGVVANLLDPNREGSRPHNAMCALVCGMAMAEGKVVVMLQEGDVPQPIDYRDVVQAYDEPRQVIGLLEEPVREVVARLQEATGGHAKPPAGLLESLDLGDVAAENEITGLREYFVRTGQFRQALQGRARLVVGRKGTGKTAVFYEIRDAIGASRADLVLDMKPDGHQFTKLREAILDELPLGLQEHTVIAFWNYILLSELAHKVLTRELHYAQMDPLRLERYRELEDAYLAHRLASGDDLSQRLLRQVDRLVERFEAKGEVKHRDDLTELIYEKDIADLDDAVSAYLSDKRSVSMLIDNIDKSWATRGTTTDEILIVRGLLEAGRKLQRQLERGGVDFRCLVFLRTDIWEHLQRSTPDRGKDSAVRLDMDDSEVLREIVKRRIESSTSLEGDFTTMWPTLFESHIGAEESFHYMLDRTLMRPRDVLTFIQRAVEVAVNRGQEKVRAQDILQAEQSFSEDMLVATAYEIEDTHPILAEVVYAFQGAPVSLTPLEMEARLRDEGVVDDAIPAAIELLLWFSVLGIVDPTSQTEKYSYQVRFNLRQLTHAVAKNEARYVIHPAFRAALGIAKTA